MQNTNKPSEFKASTEFLSLDENVRHTIQFGFSQDKKSFESLIFQGDPQHYVHVTGIPRKSVPSFMEYLREHPYEVSRIEQNHDGDDIEFEVIVKEEHIPLDNSSHELRLGRDISPAFEPFITLEPAYNNVDYLQAQRERIYDYLNMLQEIGVPFDKNYAVIEWIKANHQVFRVEHPFKATHYHLFGPSTYGDLKYCTQEGGHLWHMANQEVRRFYFTDSKFDPEETRECVKELEENIGLTCPDCSKYEN